MNYPIDKDFKKVLKYLDFKKFKLTKKTLRMINFIYLFSVLFRSTEKGTKSRSLKMKGYQGKDVKLTYIEPKNKEEETPLIIYFHGGGFIIKAGPHAYKQASILAREANVSVLLVDYHIGLKFDIPYAFEDSYAALEFAKDNYQKLRINPKKIILMGDSAGGYLAANTSILSLKRSGPSILGQLLIYPVIAPYLETESMKKYDDTPVWNNSLSKQMYELYFKGENELYNLLNKDGHNLPKTYIEIHEFDCLHDEGELYHQHLLKANVNSIIKEVKQSFHGVDVFLKKPFVKKLIQERIQVIKDIIKD